MNQIKFAKRAALIYLIAIAIAIFPVTWLALQHLVWQLFALISLALMQITALLICLRFYHRGNLLAGFWTSILSTFVLVISVSFLISEMGLVLGLGIMVITFTTAPQILTGQDINRAILLSFLVSIIVGIVDLLAPPTQLALPTLQTIASTVMGLLVLVYAVWFTTQLRAYRMPVKLTAAFLLVALLPLTVLAYTSNRQAKAIITQQANKDLADAAMETAAAIDTFIQANTDAIRTEAQLPAFANYLALPPSQRSQGSEEKQVLATLLELSRKNRPFILSYALLDANGINLIATVDTPIGLDYAQQDFFQKPIETGLPFASPVTHPSEATTPATVADNAVFHFSSPIFNETGDLLGVLYNTYHAGILQTLIVQNNNAVGEKSFALLLDENDILLAHGTNPAWRFKSVVPLSQTEITQFRANGRLPATTDGDLSINAPSLAAGLENSLFSPGFVYQLEGQENNPLLAVAHPLTTQSWSIVFTQPQATLLASLQVQSRTTFLIVILIGAIVVTVAFATGQRIAQPLVQLSDIVQEFTAGDLTVRAPVSTKDETGQLAANFNIMAHQVGQLLRQLEEHTYNLETEVLERKRIEAELRTYQDHLEDQVQARTYQLQQTNEQLERELAERQRAEEALQTSEIRYKALFDNAPVAIFTKDRDGRYTSVNATALKYWQNDPVGSTDAELLPDYIAEPLRDADLEVMESGQELVFEETFESPHGLTIVLSRKVPLRDGLDQIIGVLGISIDITERKQAEIMMQQAKEEAEKANRAKSTFLANMSHELRTPLGAIIGYSEMLEEEAEDADYQDIIPDLQKIQTAGRHLLGLINQVLDLSKIESGKMDLYLEPFAPAIVVRNIVNTVKPILDKNNNHIDVQYGEDLGTMVADITKVRQTLLNLLSNAAKFTENGQIYVTVTRETRNEGTATDHDWMHFSIRDTGIGMTKNQLHNLFQPFVQGDASTTRKYGGTGLGLAISQRFCQMMGGDITVESEPGQGSTFDVRLPVQAQKSPPVTN